MSSTAASPGPATTPGPLGGAFTGLALTLPAIASGRAVRPFDRRRTARRRAEPVTDTTPGTVTTEVTDTTPAKDAAAETWRAQLIAGFRFIWDDAGLVAAVGHRYIASLPEPETLDPETVGTETHGPA